MGSRRGRAALPGGEVEQGVDAVDRALGQGEGGVGRHFDRVDVVRDAADRLPGDAADRLGDVGEQVFDRLGVGDLEDPL